ncbi:hypothetical protein ONE63_000061 [Megalurothrips usitatus]|uniref:Suppressor protein SRP40-like n=1 Tax=Megalurothrips usitatus TaxID=439358 RepID=A0AAV7Y1C6_9NEOP|nr:hypothetical protein ONE63_000061 [Megalurothrips usitatus]
MPKIPGRRRHKHRKDHDSAIRKKKRRAGTSECDSNSSVSVASPLSSCESSTSSIVDSAEDSDSIASSETSVSISGGVSCDSSVNSSDNEDNSLLSSHGSKPECNDLSNTVSSDAQTETLPPPSPDEVVDFEVPLSDADHKAPLSEKTDHFSDQFLLNDVKSKLQLFLQDHCICLLELRTK